jgi:peptidoglycan/xylan/chitin deacetylase (PgdA/CDA1 family)
MTNEGSTAGHVCLTFDFDGPSLWLQRRQDGPTPISRGEFGAVAVPRILRLLDRRSITATFFIPGHTIDTYPDVCRRIADAGCEIALHGYAHELNAGLDRSEEEAILDRSIEAIEKLTGSGPAGYRAPSGDVTEQTLELLISRGITYDSSLMGHDYQPYKVRLGTTFPTGGPPAWGEETDLVELPWSWTLDDYVYLEFVTFRRMLMPGLRSPTEMFDNFAGDVAWMVREVERGVCTPVFHPQVIGRGHRLLAMEAWLDQISDLGVTFERLVDIAHAYNAGTEFGVEAG